MGKINKQKEEFSEFINDVSENFNNITVDQFESMIVMCSIENLKYCITNKCGGTVNVPLAMLAREIIDRRSIVVDGNDNSVDNLFEVQYSSDDETRIATLLSEASTAEELEMIARSNNLTEYDTYNILSRNKDSDDK